MTERTVILHYHLFKNAGTSFDGILRRNFPGRWVQREFDAHGRANAGAVEEWIAGTPGAVAFSSHTANGPLPRIDGVRVISVAFLRDPVARIRSAYAFERRQGLSKPGALVGADLAARTDLAGYVAARLSVRGDRQCRDFHVARLSTFVPGPPERELERAIAALSLLDFIGRVEDFSGSLDRFARLVRAHWPHFDPRSLHLNRSAPEEAEASPAVLALLEENNAQDRALIAAAEAGIWRAP